MKVFLNYIEPGGDGQDYGGEQSFMESFEKAYKFYKENGKPEYDNGDVELFDYYDENKDKKQHPYAISDFYYSLIEGYNQLEIPESIGINIQIFDILHTDIFVHKLEIVKIFLESMNKQHRLIVTSRTWIDKETLSIDVILVHEDCQITIVKENSAI